MTMSYEQIVSDLRTIAEYFMEQSCGSVPVCLEEAIKIIENVRPLPEAYKED